MRRMWSLEWPSCPRLRAGEYDLSEVTAERETHLILRLHGIPFSFPAPGVFWSLNPFWGFSLNLFNLGPLGPLLSSIVGNNPFLSKLRLYPSAPRAPCPYSSTPESRSGPLGSRNTTHQALGGKNHSDYGGQLPVMLCCVNRQRSHLTVTFPRSRGISAVSA